MATVAEELIGKQECVEQAAVIARLKDVSKDYKTVKALRNVSLTVRQGEVLALLGPNGAGKTTLVKLLLGLIGPTAGTVTVFGVDPRNAANRVRMGAMLEVARVPETLRVREHIDLFSGYYPRPLAISETIAAAGLSGLENRRFSELSKGQKQRVLFALAVCGNPALLFLDEPTAGLDVDARRIVWDEIRRRVDHQRMVLLTTHDMEEADALAHRIVVINRGTIIAEGTPAEIKARAACRRIRCVTHLTSGEVRAIPGVLKVRQDHEMLEIQVKEAENVIRQLLARDVGLSGIEVVGAGLEEAFLALTRVASN